MRSYRQYCAVARALDLVGDRWSLLVVRELLIRGPSRYTDLRAGLPGIATNLLADRLRELEEAGIVQRVDAPPPIATTLYELTGRGAELAPVVHALGNWGAALMTRRQGTDEFRSHWLAFPLSRLIDSSPDLPPVTIQIRTGDQPIVVETVNGSVHARPGTVAHPHALLDGPPELVIGLLRGLIDQTQAKRRGLRITGDKEAIGRLQPIPTPSAEAR